MNKVKMIKLVDIWKLGTGIKCLIDDKQYLYLGRGVDGLGEFLDTDTLQVVYEDEFQAEDIIVEPIPDIDGLIEAKTRQILQLIDEGWTDSGEFLNGTRYLEELKMYKKVQEAVNG